MSNQENKISQSEINNIAWKACDTFRGVVDPAEYKNYILVMLFLKYISDTWKANYEKYKEQFKGDEERIERRLKRERFILPKECTFDYLYSMRKESNIGELINIALTEIEEKNKAKLEGVFRNIDFNSESNLGRNKDRNKRLINLLKDFNDEKLDLRADNIDGEDVIGNTYEFLISRFASDAGKKGGEFYTPKEIAQLLAKLVRPKSGDRICDPCAGSGSLLIRVASEIEGNNFSLFGQESNGSTWALSKINMFLHQIDSATMKWGDTINNPQLIENDELMKFDIVVANPPFSLDKWGADTAESDKYNRFHRGIPPKSKGDFAFITHMIETTVSNTGKVGVIIPHGVLFRSAREGKIRKALIEENLLDAVIGLPSNLFFGTGIPAAILIFDKAKTSKDVLFIDASSEYEDGKKQNKLRKEDIVKIFNTFKERKAIDKYSYVASFEEMQENDFNLNIPRYVDTFEEEDPIDIREVQKKIEELEEQLSDVRNVMHGYLKELKI